MNSKNQMTPKQEKLFDSFVFWLICAVLPPLIGAGLAALVYFFTR